MGARTFSTIGSGENTGGYGGLLRTEHVKQLLQAAGQTVLAAQLQLHQQMTQQTTVSRPLPLPARSNSAQLVPKRRKVTTVWVYKGMTQVEINRLTLVEIKKALMVLNESSSGKRNKAELELRLYTVLQQKEDGFRAAFEYMK